MERETKSFAEAHAYFDRIFNQACNLVTASNDALTDDEETANASLPFDSVRVLGNGEREALMNELMEYTQAAWGEILKRVQSNGGSIDHQSVCQIIMPQLFLGFMAGYRHCVEEIELPTIEGGMPDGPSD